MRSFNPIRHLILPGLAFAVAVFVLEYWQLDLKLAHILFDWQGGQWRYRHDPLLAKVLHTDARNLMLMLFAALGLCWVWLRVCRREAQALRGLAYLLASILLSAGLVSLLKHLTHMDCPWDLQAFGGNRPYISLWQPRTPGLEDGICFPAGHASAAYAWLGLYFLCRHYQPRWRYLVLAGVLLLGMLFGGVQQVRGAHFISHDVWTLTLCWFCAALLYPCMLGRRDE